MKSLIINTIKLIARYIFIIFNSFFTLMKPKRNLVIFESFNGNDVNDNPAAIYYEWIKQNPDKQNLAIFSVKPSKYKYLKNKYPQIVFCKRFTFKWTYLMARANFWVFNSRMPKWWKKNPKTTYIQTWHGTPLKKLGIDIEDVSIPGSNTIKYHNNFRFESSRWNYLIVPNEYSENIFRSAFAFKNTFLKTGYPRNDRLVLDNNKTEINNIKKSLGIKTENVIMYAPTWRDDDFKKIGQYNFKLHFSFDDFFENVSEQTTLIIRPHYLIKDHIDISGFEDRIKILVDEDISQLYLISDLLITDYSSVMFDYANLKRPMLFFTYDIDHYKNDLRGFYFDFINDAPGPIVKTQTELMNKLVQFQNVGSFIEYKDKQINFFNKFCELDHGNAASQVVQVMEEKYE
ncbi:CDP-glycerol glycerophosphotransferase family protein [Lactobacillus sp. S2-2]|uniref:CDP-glycerol glycerophosphotransferase family protein n=1 Tax=Lactobacillus sp. S2-2 TaxID=2692917 RepID=UPI001F33E9D0|nr:CDP-glycerol glycerophosphotransferase family protein [Lactobacillus sp. S2-2]